MSKGLRGFLIVFLFLGSIVGAHLSFSGNIKSEIVRNLDNNPEDSIAPDSLSVESPEFRRKKSKYKSWADSVFKQLTPDEKIAQLFMVAAYSNRDKKHVDQITELIEKYKIGGLIFFQGGPVRQARQTNYYQRISKTPLLISIDGEWGLAMRLDSTVQYPRQMALGAIQKDTLIYQMGAQIAEECKRLGIHVNLAPVVDVNSNPLNPVIGIRSFGEDKYNVARKGVAYMKGMQDNCIMANAKHFPGHGDTDSDSHLSLPIINHTAQRIDSIDLYPFKQLIKEGLGSAMVAHLYIPAYDTAKNVASTLSKSVVTSLLKDSLKFRGLIFTDALNMKGVSAYYKPGEVDLKALLAGNDVLLFAEDVPTAIKQIKLAIDSNLITQKEIDDRCLKVLMAKQWSGLDKFKPIQLNNLYQDLNSRNADFLNRQLTEASLTLVSNQDSILPLKRLDTLKIATLSIGDIIPNVYQQSLGRYAPVTHFGIKSTYKQAEIDSIIKELKRFNLVIAGLNNTNHKAALNFGITQQTLNILDSIQLKSKVILSVFANAYSLARFPQPEKFKAIIMAYEDNKYTQDLAGQLIFGGIGAIGRLPITASNYFPIGTGIETLPIRLKYTVPEELGLDVVKLDKINDIVASAIKSNAIPGCQILVAKDGKVIFDKSFGYQTYENKIPVSGNDLYDLASITKIAATVPSVMKLQENGLINIDKTLGDYLPELKGTNKESIIIREMLAHQAGLKSWIPFWTSTISRGEYDTTVFSLKQNDTFSIRVAENLYIKKEYADSIYKKIIESPVSSQKQYVYSDLGYYFLHKIIEKQTNQKLEEYLSCTFFNGLGLTNMTYKPRERFPLERIVPTEYDIAFRKQLIHGDVHDQGAAMLGGVAGHAGLFSNSKDLATLMQMYLNNGKYAGEEYFKTETLNEFTRCQFAGSGNRRGAGFDKPEPNINKESPVCRAVSLASYGHSGFTGTFTWVDPVDNLLYIFLSNRVYPDAENRKLITQNIRGKIHEVIYESLKTPKSFSKL